MSRTKSSGWRPWWGTRSAIRPWRTCTAVAASMETRHPLAASLCRRAMVEEVLKMAQTSRYPRAVRPLDGCRRQASAIDAWGRSQPHNT